MNKIALVTGSSKGIGKAVAIKLARENYIVFVTYNTDKQSGKKTIAEIEKMGGKAHLMHLDVCIEDDVKTMFKSIKKQYGHLNILINNAGIEISKDIENITFDEWKIVTETKINGVFLCTKYALPLLKGQKNANLINITSSLGDNPDPQLPAYCAGTAGIIAFTKAMAIGLGKYGIRTNGISPGATRTSMWNNTNGNNNEMWTNFAKNNPMGRVSTPQDIANTIAMVINDKSKYLNGNFIYVNGGSHLT